MLVKIFDTYVNPDNVCNVEPKFEGSKEVGCSIWYNTSMTNRVFSTEISFAIRNGKPLHRTVEVVNALNKGINLND